MNLLTPLILNVNRAAQQYKDHLIALGKCVGNS